MSTDTEKYTAFATSLNDALLALEREGLDTCWNNVDMQSKRQALIAEQTKQFVYDHAYVVLNDDPVQPEPATTSEGAKKDIIIARFRRHYEELHATFQRIYIENLDFHQLLEAYAGSCNEDAIKFFDDWLEEKFPNILRMAKETREAYQQIETVH